MTAFNYGVIGRGRWGARIAAILTEMGRPVTVIGRSQAPPRQVDVLWIAVPPVAQEAVVEASLATRCHLVVEKPWLASAALTASIGANLRNENRHVAVHFEYCYLSELAPLAASPDFQGTADFLGAFETAKANRLKIPALQNLGIHIAAIRRRWFSSARLVNVEAAYGTRERRLIELASRGMKTGVDFTNQRQPVIQRFIEDFESHIRTGTRFPLDLEFARASLSDLESLPRRG